MSTQEEITVSLVTSESDFPTVVQIEGAAFAHFPSIQLMFPPGSDPASLAVSRHVSVFKNDPTARYVVARTTSGEIIGFGKWNFFTSPESVAGPQHPWPMDFTPRVNADLIKFYFEGMDKERNDWMRKGKSEGEPGKKHFLMATLCVSPGWQRKGVGKKILEWGLDIADREGVECWIDASPEGKGLYEKMGWKEVSGIDVEHGRWGGEEGEVTRTVCMIREPKKAKARENND